MSLQKKQEILTKLPTKQGAESNTMRAKPDFREFSKWRLLFGLGERRRYPAETDSRPVNFQKFEKLNPLSAHIEGHSNVQEDARTIVVVFVWALLARTE